MLVIRRRKAIKRIAIAISLLVVTIALLGIAYRKTLANYRQSLFVTAASQGRLTRMKVLLAVGASVDEPACPASTCVSPIIAAAWGEKTEAVELLLDRGANVNSKTANGETALMGPAYHGNKEVLKLLLSKGADVNCEDSVGDTALAWAKKKGHPEIVDLLVSAGAAR